MNDKQSTAIQLSDLAPGLSVGENSGNWRPIADLPLLILVGVTGVGKSTTVDTVRQAGVHFTLLPNRRDLTDQLIISQMQQLDEEPVQKVTDRQARFEYTRRYRELHPGGMAHALRQLQIDPVQLNGLLLFDGLRGVNEVSYAATHLPTARFIVLNASDVVRVQRLLGRNDAFDQIEATPTNPDDVQVNDFAALGVPAAQQLFSAADEAVLLNLVHTGAVTADDLAGKLRIVVTERQNYAPTAAIAALREVAPARTIVVDTVQMSPTKAAEMIGAFVARPLHSGLQ